MVLKGFFEIPACEKVTRWACRADASVGFFATVSGEGALASDLSEYLSGARQALVALETRVSQLSLGVARISVNPLGQSDINAGSIGVQGSLAPNLGGHQRDNRAHFRPRYALRLTKSS